jgi:hypothetical protein
MKRRLYFSALAGLVVAFLASYCAYLPTHVLLTKSENYQLHTDHDKLTEALTEYRAATGSFPERLTEIKLPMPSPSGIDDQGIPLDPWGTPYVYERQGDSYSLRSLGSDGEPGGWGTKADVMFPAEPEAPFVLERMTYWEFMIDQPTTGTALTSALAGICTFAIGGISALRKKDSDEPIASFVVAMICLSFVSLFVGGLLATWHVPIGEHH